MTSLVAGLCGIRGSAAEVDAVAVDFETVHDAKVTDQTGAVRARLVGDAAQTTDAHGGESAIRLGDGPRDCLDFGPTFGMTQQATIEFWCKPKTLSGIIVGKQGVINIEFPKGQNTIRVGLILKTGWVRCELPAGSVCSGQWQHIHVSWGSAGLVLIVDGTKAARTPLPEKREWRDLDYHFFIGTYNCPTPYDVWFYHGLVDDLVVQPRQVLPADVVLPDPRLQPQTVPPLELRLVETPKPAYSAALPALVRGRIVLDANANGVAEANEEGAPGVSVTDGYAVTRTDGSGAYELAPGKDSVFVYITKPSGLTVTGSWYKPLAAGVDFTVTRTNDEDDYTFIHVTDTHVSTNPRSTRGLSAFVREVNALDPQPRFVLNSGDLVNLDKRLNASAATGHAYFRNYVGIMNHLTMPFYNVAGDHTDSSYRIEQFPRGDHRCGKPMYWEYLGPHFFSFEYGRIHFVSVDFSYHLGERKGYATNTLLPEHVRWLSQDMSRRGPGTFVMTTSEHDLGRVSTAFPGLAKRHDVRLQLTGDDHIFYHRREPVPYRAGGSLSGCWWNPACEGLCPDLSPQGYAIYRVQGDTVECFYKGLGQRITIVSHRYGAHWHGSVRLQAHIVAPAATDTLEWSLDGKTWTTMAEVARPFYRTVYEAEINSEEIPDGIVGIRVRNPGDGEVFRRPFVVDNRAGATARTSGARLSVAVGTAARRRKAPGSTVEVLLNGVNVGTLPPGDQKEYTFPVAPEALRTVNRLAFRFSQTGDVMSIGSPRLEFEGTGIEDPRCAAIRKVKIAHWGEKAADWGGFIVGEGLPEGPFDRKQDTFLFVLNGN